MTIRKNFLFDDEVVQHLKKIAQNENITQTRAIQNMIEEKYQEISVKEKLEALDSITGWMNGLIGDKVSIQSIKMEMGSKI